MALPQPLQHPDSLPCRLILGEELNHAERTAGTSVRIEGQKTLPLGATQLPSDQIGLPSNRHLIDDFIPLALMKEMVPRHGDIPENRDVDAIPLS